MHNLSNNKVRTSLHVICQAKRERAKDKIPCLPLHLAIWWNGKSVDLWSFISCIGVFYLLINMFLVQPTLPAAGKRAPRVGNLGHITRISNKLVQLGNSSTRIQTYLQVGGKKLYVCCAYNCIASTKFPKETPRVFLTCGTRDKSTGLILNASELICPLN